MPATIVTKKRTVYDVLWLKEGSKPVLVKTHRSEMQARNHKSILSGTHPGQTYVIESREAK